MSRFKRFAHSLVSGYVLLGANMLYTLASVPLAWHFLSKDQFGLWFTTATIGGYIVLLDFGMGGSVARILIDTKLDHRIQTQFCDSLQLQYPRGYPTLFAANGRNRSTRFPRMAMHAQATLAPDPEQSVLVVPVVLAGNCRHAELLALKHNARFRLPPWRC